MNIQHLVTGAMAVNTYILYHSNEGEALIVDPGGSEDQIVEAIKEKGLKPLGILLTHGHADHIAGVEKLRNMLSIPVWIHAGDAAMLGNPQLNLSALINEPLEVSPAQRLLSDGDVICIDDQLLTVRHTPGHTPGGICLVGTNLVLTGDTLFAGSIGRTDFPGGDTETLIGGIHQHLLSLDDSCRVFPGHGPLTFIGKERQQNPFLIGHGHGHAD